MMPAFLEKAPCLYLATEDPKCTGSVCLVVLEAANLLESAKAFLAAGYHLEDVCGLAAAEGAVVAYHFDHFDKPGRVTVLVIAPYAEASFPSIASVYDGAEWHERETRDFYGFAFDGNPNLVPLLLPDDMSEVHPLYKEEKARAPLAKLFSAPEGARTVVRKADGFIALDMPVAPAKEEPATAQAAAPAAKAEGKPEAKAEPKAEAQPKAAPAGEPADKPVTEEAPKKGGDDA